MPSERADEARPGGFAVATHRAQLRRLREVAREALRRYGIEPAALSLLVAHLHNTTFAVTGRDGARFVLHLLDPAEDAIFAAQTRARIESELWWLAQLEAEAGRSIPVAVHTPGGEGVVAVEPVAMNPGRLCMLFHRIDGRFLYHRLTPPHLAAVGRLTARLHNVSAYLQVPGWFDRPRVDAADLEFEERMARLFTDQASREAAELVRRALRRVRRAQESLGAGPEASGLIHADIHQRNYLFVGHDVRLIDFGDCGWGHYLYDLGVTIHQLGNVPRRDALRAALLAGYREVRELSPAQEGGIDAFMLLREVQDLSWGPEHQLDATRPPWSVLVDRGMTLLQNLLAAGA